MGCEQPAAIAREFRGLLEKGIIMAEIATAALPAACFRPRWFCGRRRLGRHLQDPEGKTIQRKHRAEIQRYRWTTTWWSPRGSSPRRTGLASLVGHSYGGVVVTEAGNDPRWRRSSTSRPSLRTRASPWPRSSRIPPPGAPVPPILPPQDGYPLSTSRSSPPPSRWMWTKKVNSWPTPRFPGASRRSAAPSASPRGRPSRAGT